MKQKRFFIILFIVLITAILSMFLLEKKLLNYNKELCNKALLSKIDKLKLDYEIKKSNLERNLLEEKYLATGKNAYERIYNNNQENIVQLISEIANESLPSNWSSSVKIEEFNKFILLVDLPIDYQYNEIEIAKKLHNLAFYCNHYLKNIAIFDSKHKCIQFYDKNLINYLKRKNSISTSLIQKAKKLSEDCIRYNSVVINFTEYNSHIYIPTIISGEYGIYETEFLLDTGASMTIISTELAQKTGNENLYSLRKKTFETANGRISCPIVIRNINIASINMNKEIAVNLNDSSNILGMDFLCDKNYYIDNNAKKIFLWYK